MNFLVDANLSPRVAHLLRAANHHALQHDQVIISSDTDFGTLLAYRHLIKPVGAEYSSPLVRAVSRATPNRCERLTPHHRMAPPELNAGAPSPGSTPPPPWRRSRSNARVPVEDRAELRDSLNAFLNVRERGQRGSAAASRLLTFAAR